MEAQLDISNNQTNSLVNNDIPQNPELLQAILKKQDARKVSPFEAQKLEKEAKRNWDIFYKRNETKFFKDRHWTLREFQQLLDVSGSTRTYNLLEVGCGCGNFLFPILEEIPNLKIYACDFSPRAVDFVKNHSSYDTNRISAFTCDITEDNCFSDMKSLNYEKMDLLSMVFVLSAIAPQKHKDVATNMSKVMKPGSVLFFRDYGRYDMTQLRFKGGKKIEDNFYVRRDGTRSYFFTPEEVESIFTNGDLFEKIECEFVYRRTVNVKENVDVGRTFVQGKFRRLNTIDNLKTQ